jgi:hypothetical protein
MAPQGRGGMTAVEIWIRDFEESLMNLSTSVRQWCCLHEDEELQLQQMMHYVEWRWWSTHDADHGMIMLRLSEEIREQLIMYIQYNQTGETTLLGVILFNLHEIVEDGESLLVTTVEQLNWEK